MALDPVVQPWRAEGTPMADGRTAGVLLSHGFTGSPFSITPWAQSLNEQGFAVSVPRLPGHGTRWQDLNKTTWQDWYAEVTLAYRQLASEVDVVFAAGLSMGGGLVLQLAADHPEIAGLTLVNPAVNIARRELAVIPVLKHVVPALPGVAGDIKKEGAVEHGYGHTPLKALHSMLQGYKGVRARLSDVHCPVLLFRSEIDHVVDPSSGTFICERVSGEVDERMLVDSYHVATLDNDAPRIFSESGEFFRRISGTNEP